VPDQRRRKGAEDRERVPYAQWGEDFFAEAVSEERVLGAVNTIAGQPIDFGPMGVGPGRIAKVRAYGEIGEAAATRLPPASSGGLIGYHVVLPVRLTFEVDLQVDSHRFEAQLLVPLTLVAVALSGVRIWIEATPPTGSEIEVDLQATGLRASVLQRVADVEGELKRFVARYVAHELDKPHVQEVRLIDVSRAIDSAWASIGPTRPRKGSEEAPESATADLNEALEREIRDHESTFLGDPAEAGRELG
jgi:hypothetical protein